MAARLNPHHSEMVRTKIQASQLINRLQDHVFGEVEMTATQLKAAEVLLRKSLPDLQALNISGEMTHRHTLAEASSTSLSVVIRPPSAGFFFGAECYDR